MVLVPLNEGVQECDTFNGNIVLIPLSVYKILGTNDPYFHHSMGDLDYGMRSRKEGLKIYQLGSAVGECDRHERIMKWCDSEVSLPVRWRALHKATGYPPKEVFYFYQRHYGFCKAVFHVITTYTRCFFPSLWVKMNRANWI